ncbi:hypothetical protein XENORESO_005365 [Xenotaenia resolanae]|uniref:Uncharacterized protein n=1 Tax=Xenotaenia resolanae TaxID=208358 RepID=A0ABV0WVP6_9TELE
MIKSAIGVPVGQSVISQPHHRLCDCIPPGSSMDPVKLWQQFECNCISEQDTTIITVCLETLSCRLPSGLKLLLSCHLLSPFKIIHSKVLSHTAASL